MDNRDKNLAVIIARAGSKGLPNKAMQPLEGKPLVAWTLEHALAAQRIDDVAVSSDCDQILAVARRYGVHTYKRPAELASDTATVDAGARHGAECWAKENGGPGANVVMLYGNVALRPADLIDRALDKLITTGADSVQSVYNVGKMNPLWMKRLGGKDGDKLLMYEDNRVYRRQDLPAVYMLDAGALAITWQSLFTIDPNEPHAFLGSDRRAVETKPGDVVDIDDEVDLLYAEAVLKHKRAQQSAA